MGAVPASMAPVAEGSSPMMWSPAVEERGHSPPQEQATKQASDGIDLARDLGPGAEDKRPGVAATPALAQGQGAAGSADGGVAVEAGSANVVELQPHESPLPLPPSTTPQSQQAPAPASDVERVDEAAAAWRGFQLQSHATSAGSAPPAHQRTGSPIARGQPLSDSAVKSGTQKTGVASTPAMVGAHWLELAEAADQTPAIISTVQLDIISCTWGDRVDESLF